MRAALFIAHLGHMDTQEKALDAMAFMIGIRQKELM